MTFAVIPSIAPWRGDNRRNAAPYLTVNGGYGAMFICQWAARELRAKGISCHVDILTA
jgi:hypothetical protein